MTVQTIGLLQAPPEFRDLAFFIHRDDLQYMITEIENTPETNSVLLIKNLPRETDTDTENISENQFIVKAFFNASMTERIYNSFLLENDQPNAQCAINQRVDIEGDRMGIYYVTYEQINLMHDLFQSQPDAQCVTYDTKIWIITPDESSATIV